VPAKINVATCQSRRHCQSPPPNHLGHHGRVYRENIGKALTGAEGLNMEEAADNFTGKRIGATF
jgi:hypothetical protein